jgi:hypothetical protein
MRINRCATAVKFRTQLWWPSLGMMFRVRYQRGRDLPVRLVLAVYGSVVVVLLLLALVLSSR